MWAEWLHGVLLRGLNGLGMKSGQVHFVVFLGMTLYPQGTTLHPAQMGTGKFNAEGNAVMD